MHDLRGRRREILERLLARARAGAPPPTLDELCAELGLRSRGALHRHVQALVAAGWLEPPRGRPGLRLSARALAEAEGLPLLGRIAAGRPIEAVADPRRVPVPPALRTARPCYVLEVRGDSMIEDGILDGDWVVVEAREHARNGEVVVALIDGAEATLKRIEQRPGEVVLHPANAAMAPLRYAPERVRIQGVVVGLMRRY
ncbi:transcriptional repressor LexA [Inmirania thermothiophila]|uniref:LexA repressor n=1 Tax=Inmirania thermothiophila TaxID=1750597 RepID=A0A3N1Y183_9GAMM|nr:transcriptional repressor LexA [Inmirania thermothiophila]ROR32550.1 repressor LexA [Inmirania thermothiophila]